MVDTHSFSAWFDRQLKRHEWTPADFVRRSGIPRSTVYSWLNNSRKPGAEYIEAIADAFSRRKNDVLVIAGIADPDPDVDPESNYAQVLGMVNRIDWETYPDRLETARRVMSLWLEQDERERAKDEALERDAADEGRRE